MNNTEEEQIATFKKWWADNGRAIIVGVVLGAGVIFGWRFWESRQHWESQSASLIYQSVVDEFNKNDSEQMGSTVQSLQDDYASTPYAALASLLAAKLAVDRGQLNEAATALRWAMQHSPEEGVRIIAGLRLARVLSAQGRHDDALVLLNESFPASYTAMVAELKGDVLMAQGNIGPAREAYGRASIGGPVGGNVQLLQMKLDDLSTVKGNSLP